LLTIVLERKKKKNQPIKGRRTKTETERNEFHSGGNKRETKKKKKRTTKEVWKEMSTVKRVARRRRAPSGGRRRRQGLWRSQVVMAARVDHAWRKEASWNEK